MTLSQLQSRGQQMIDVIDRFRKEAIDRAAAVADLKNIPIAEQAAHRLLDVLGKPKKETP